MTRLRRELGPFAWAALAAVVIAAILLVLYAAGMVYFSLSGPPGPGSGGGTGTPFVSPAP